MKTGKCVGSLSLVCLSLASVVAIASPALAKHDFSGGSGPGHGNGFGWGDQWGSGFGWGRSPATPDRASRFLGGDARSDWRDLRGDRTDIRRDWLGVRADKREVRGDMQQLRLARKSGQNLAPYRAKVRADRLDVRRDFSDLRADKRDIHFDRKDLNADWRTASRGMRKWF